MRSRSWISLLYVVSSLAGGASARAQAVATCDELLRPEATAAQVRAYLEESNVPRTATLVEHLRQITDRLVDRNTITREQAETVFADRVLGDFGQIFLKYAIAELRDRAFTDDQIVRFVLHFEDAYGVEDRVDFALSVARRMLVTVGEGTSSMSGAGIDRFTEMYQGLGVDAKSWARFGNVWEVVRTEHLPTVIHFILTNLNRTSERVRAQIEERLEAARRPPAKPSRFWSPFVTPESPAPTVEEIARAYLGRIEVPSFMTDIDCLRPERAAPVDVLTRACRPRPTFDVDKFIRRLEASPRFGREYLLGAQLEHMTLEQLETLRRWPGFARLGEAWRQRVGAEVARLVEVRRLSEAIGRELLRRREVDRAKPGAIPQFRSFARAVEWLATDLLARGAARGPETPAARATGLVRDFNGIRDAYPRLSNAQFIDLARAVATRTFKVGNGAMALAVMRVLMVLSREFALDPAAVRGFLDEMQAFLLEEPGYEGLRPIREFDDVDVLMDPANWGGDDAEDKGKLDRLPDLVAKLRAILPPADSEKIVDDAFYPDVAR